MESTCFGAPGTSERGGQPLMDRRGFVLMSTFLIFGGPVLRLSGQRRRQGMYGIIGRIHAVEGAREALASVLLDGIPGMPGCLSYVVASDSEDPNALWVTEAWDSETSHQASLDLPSVRAVIERGRPMIAGFGERYITTPLGGHGLG
jgi:quinol monooxygenase YgiN